MLKKKSYTQKYHVRDRVPENSSNSTYIKHCQSGISLTKQLNNDKTKSPHRKNTANICPKQLTESQSLISGIFMKIFWQKNGAFEKNMSLISLLHNQIVPFNYCSHEKIVLILIFFCFCLACLPRQRRVYYHEKDTFISLSCSLSHSLSITFSLFH